MSKPDCMLVVHRLESLWPTMTTKKLYSPQPADCTTTNGGGKKKTRRVSRREYTSEKLSFRVPHLCMDLLQQLSQTQNRSCTSAHKCQIKSAHKLWNRIGSTQPSGRRRGKTITHAGRMRRVSPGQEHAYLCALAVQCCTLQQTHFTELCAPAHELQKRSVSASAAPPLRHSRRSARQTGKWP